MDTPNIEPRSEAPKPSPVDQSVERAVRSVEENYVVVGATHIRTWQGVLILGIAAGVAAGVLFVASRSGGLEPSSAAPAPAPVASPAVRSFSDGFDRADGPNVGNGWNEAAGDFRIEANELRNTEGIVGRSVLVHPGYPGASQTVSGSFASTNNDSVPVLGFVLRYQDPNNYYALYRRGGGSSGLFITKVTGGNESKPLAQIAVPNSVKNEFFDLDASAEGNILTLQVTLKGAGPGRTDVVRKISYTDGTAPFSNGLMGVLMGSNSNFPKLRVAHRVNVFTGIAANTPPAALNHSSIPLPTGSLTNGSGLVLYRFRAEATSADFPVDVFPFAFKTSGATFTRFQLFGYSDSAFTQPAYAENPIAEQLVEVRDVEHHALNFVPTSSSIIIPASTSRYFELRADAAAVTGAAYITSSFGGLPGSTLVSSGGPGTPTPPPSSSATLSLTLDPSSPPKRLVVAGTEVPVTAIRLHATGEAVQLSQMVFKLGGNARPQDLSKISLWDGATKVGEVVTTSSPSGIIMTIPSGMVTIPQDGDKILKVTAELANIGIGQPGKAGDTLSVDWDQVGTIGGASATYGVGMQSGARVYATGTDTVSAGVRIFRAFPTVQMQSLPSVTLTNGERALYRFALSAPAGTNGVGLYRFTFRTVLSDDEGDLGDLRLTALKVFGYADANFATPAYGTGQLNNGPLVSLQSVNEGTLGNPILFNPTNPSLSVGEAIEVPAGTTRYFELRGTVSGVDAGDSLSLALFGDDTQGTLGTASWLDTIGGGVNDFIWSGNATTTSPVNAPDWTNGYLIPGLPSNAPGTPTNVTLIAEVPSTSFFGSIGQGLLRLLGVGE